ncbi:MAG: hypothetical protein ACTS27_09390 [Phycisphaerales bacterium]
MLRAAVDPAVSRLQVGEFDFPLGVYPVDAAQATPAPGFVSDFEQADGDETGDWEEWPDRYMFDIVAPRKQVETLCLALFSMLPGRVFPILDVLSEDAYREIDPYIAYESVSFERFIDEIRRYRSWFYDDGMVGFGAMSLDPFVYVFVDEHKIVTARVETSMKGRVEKLLAALEIPQADELSGVDSTEHEHRSILALELEGRQFASHAEIVERMRERWALSLNIDWDANVDDDGRVIGMCGWRVDVRRFDEREQETGRWEVLLAAESLAEAEMLAIRGVAEEFGEPSLDDETLRERYEMLEGIRLRPEMFSESIGQAASFDQPTEAGVRAVRSWTA